jgi:hypothetical protein
MDDLDEQPGWNWQAIVTIAGALILAACIGAGACWFYMHNDLATGYRLGRIQGHKDALSVVGTWMPCNSIGDPYWQCDRTADEVYELIMPTAQGSEVK